MKLLLLFLFIFVPVGSFAQNRAELVADTVIVYRANPHNKLYFYYPSSISQCDMPALVLFFGGGWNGGEPKQLESQARYLIQYGIVVVLADYRTKDDAGTTPKEALMDAKSAIRFLRGYAKNLHIDPDKILAGGASAGGHLAAAAAFCGHINHSDDDLSVSSRPQALVLFNPVIDNGPGGYGYERVSEYYQSFSPIDNISGSVPPPTIFFLGTSDKHIPVKTGELFQQRMKEAGGRCDLRLYPGRTHGFFNKRNEKDFQSTMKETVEFLKSLGYVSE